MSNIIYPKTYDTPEYDPFTQGNYTFYRARDIKNAPMFRPLAFDSVIPYPWSFKPATSECREKSFKDTFYKVPINRKGTRCGTCCAVHHPKSPG